MICFNNFDFIVLKLYIFILKFKGGEEKKRKVKHLKERNLRHNRLFNKKSKILIIAIAFLIILASIVIYLFQSNMTDLEDITDFEYDNSINTIPSDLPPSNQIQSRH